MQEESSSTESILIGARSGGLTTEQQGERVRSHDHT